MPRYCPAGTKVLDHLKDSASSEGFDADVEIPEGLTGLIERSPEIGPGDPDPS